MIFFVRYTIVEEATIFVLLHVELVSSQYKWRGYLINETNAKNHLIFKMERIDF